ncbi:GAF domain-containing protein [Aliiglaciecola lipolytica]|uniref:GAF domain-containing protein A n=1 Tax=Aliiglaciecola lipolytica E3 TaxID=1127673 RepID=K6YDX8_9ALTE|nr:GAF domain-containing protein [Aliiglaciecola lipolytica]GAC14818.1 GAF domain-containing protein A [Aliiglaciecola lipolytica E3]
MSIDNEKTDFYHSLTKQAQALIGDERNLVANLANLSALLFMSLDDVNWVGFYLVDENELVLGPFQGKPACIRIPIGKGVCGTAALNRTTQIVADVHQFEGHIACDAASQSEIVIPILSGRRLIGVLDIDSPIVERFDSVDGLGLQQIVDVLQETIC